MRNRGILYIMAAVAAGILMSASLSMAASVGLKIKDGIGNYLVDDKGATLYIFKKDAPNKSVCGAAGGCLDKWPVFFADKQVAVNGLNAADFGVITRDDGKQQTTFKGMPLYFFFKDVKAGDTNGQGVNNVWFAAVP